MDVTPEKWEADPEAGPGPRLPELPESWPQSGDLELKDLSVRYREGLPLVLDRVSIGPVPSGSRLGICGRTGSGKSTTAMCLFRCQ